MSTIGAERATLFIPGPVGDLVIEMRGVEVNMEAEAVGVTTAGDGGVHHHAVRYAVRASGDVAGVVRGVNVAERLALAVLQGDRVAALMLADRVQEEHAREA